MIVLLVDDNADQLSVRGLLLEQQGFETLPAISREEAAAVLQSKGPVDCAVVDLCLPDLDTGLATLRDLRASSPALRLIALTGYCVGTWQYAAAHDLANEVVVKGAGVAGLIEALRRTKPFPLAITASAAACAVR